MAKLPTPQELIASRPEFPSEPWLDIKPKFAPGSFCYPAKKETMELLHMPNPHDWDPAAEDWNLPENWEQILCDAFEDRLQKHRSLKLFMDICVRCGACADKCHFFLGTNDPKNHARAACRAAALPVPPRLHQAGQDPRQARRRPRLGQGRGEGTLLLRLPVHRMPPLLPVLPLRHRHRRDHGHRARTAARSGPGHPLDHGPGEKLLLHGQPPGHPAPLLRGDRGHAGR